MTSLLTTQNVLKATFGVALGAYCVYSFLSLYAIVYLGGAAYTLHLFIRNPDLFHENKESITMIEKESRVVLPKLDMDFMEQRQPSYVQRPSAVTHFKNKESMSAFVASPVAASPMVTPRSAPISRASYVPSKKPRQHRVPVVAPRRESTLTSATSSPFTKTIDPPHCGYESDSSHASSSSGRSASSATLGLPTYEKHATVIFTLSPKRPGYVPQVQAILKTARNSWLALPGAVSHEVGQDAETGSVVVVETYESNEHLIAYEKSNEREQLVTRLKAFIDDRNIGVVRLPASSAATRAR